MVPTLKEILDDYPESPEAVRAAEMSDIIQNGYSANIPVDFEDKSLFKYDDNNKHFIIIFLPKDENSSLAKSKIADFSREYFSRDRLSVKSKIYGNDESIVLVEDFEGDSKAKEYVRVYKSTRKHLLDLQNAKIFAITQENLKTLFQTQKLDEYERFYDEYY